MVSDTFGNSDRWQEAVTAEPGLLLERQEGKYDVGRLISCDRPQMVARDVIDATVVKRLDAA